MVEESNIGKDSLKKRHELVPDFNVNWFNSLLTTQNAMSANTTRAQK